MASERARTRLGPDGVGAGLVGPRGVRHVEGRLAALEALVAQG